jgi:single-stranded DNA-specific DHH superfamily exonuclease
MGRQNRKLLENIRKLNEKEKTKQQESQILGQKPVNRKINKEKSINVYDSNWSKGIWGMV